MHSLFSLLFLTPVLTAPQQEAPRLTAFDLADEAQRFVPPYDGTTREFLTAQEEREVSAAASLLEAAIHLDGEQPYLHWWKGHCRTLLAENAKNRGREEESGEHWEIALAALDRALELQPDYYWAYYARGMARHKTDHFWRAIDDYSMAEELADQAAESDGVDALQVRYHARQWRADTRMRVFEFEQAREEFRVFYAANGNNQWDLATSLSESYLREHDYVGAQEIYEGVLEVPEYVPWSITYEQMGNVLGLTGRNAEACEWIVRSFEHELVPGMYSRLWLWLLSAEDERGGPLEDLTEFLTNPPPSLSEWDRRLGLFMIGGETPADFLEGARAEAERRRREAEAMGDLMCEAWFYAGMRQELDADRVGDAPVLGKLQGALQAYREALAFRPRQNKWEWEFARLRLNDLAPRVGARARVDFEVKDGRIAFEEEISALQASPLRSGSLERVVRHVPGRLEPTFLAGELGEEPLVPGELIQCVVRAEDGRRFALTLVVDAETASDGG